MKKFLKSGSVIVVLGPGGVGKTTIAAALGLASAQANYRSGVITVDPARRLRDALGLPRLGTTPTRIDPRRLRSAGLDPHPQFFAMMQDTKATWDSFVARFVTDPAVQQRIFANTFYRNLTTDFAGAENYASLEQLYSLHESGQFDIEIVDTPPAIQTFDFIEAPENLIKLLGSRSAQFIVSWTKLSKSSGFNLADRLARRVVAELEKVAGARPLLAIADFFADTGESLDAIVERMRSANALLHSAAVKFVLVTTAAHDRLEEATALVRELKARRLKLVAVVINRAGDAEMVKARGRRSSRYRQAIAGIRTASSHQQMQHQTGPVLDFLQGYVEEQEAAIERIAGFARELSNGIELMVVPELGSGAVGLEGLARIAGKIVAS
ncbi:MAG TPA: ArsA-related P-loop ATPase [Candidatus Binataceae bacterium]|nr:ArsA-related P-loop ATPase [Candidatus Binataceae bacterium]